MSIRLKRITCTIIVLSLSICWVGTMSAYGEIRVEGLDSHPDLKHYVSEIAQERKDETTAKSQLKDDLLRALKAKGYYDATLDTSDGESEADIIFNVTPGKVYRIGQVTIEQSPADSLTADVEKGDVLDAQDVLSAQKNLYDTVEENYCYYNLDIRHQVKLNTNDKTADITFTIHGQAHAKFGDTAFKGADDISRAYLAKYLQYESGECWSSTKLEDTKAALYATGLLASVGVTLPETVKAGEPVPVSFIIKKRAFRSVKLGAGYNTSDGAGVTAEWEHRNIFGSGEKLSFKGRFYELNQNISAEFNKPFFLREDQSLFLETSMKRENNDAYKDLAYTVSGSIIRQVTEDLSVSLGSAYELSRIEDEEGRRNYGLFSIPASVDYDARDDILDPHRGWRIGLKTTPFFDTLGEANPFIKARATASTYFDLSKSSFDPVLALRASYGAIYGTELTDIPASKRFYSGGGGSVRGFGYQDIGPKEEDGDPSGGRSIAEVTGELRFKLSDDYGGVAFVDAGQVYDTTSPDFGADLAIGAGVGARYYTDFGPLRFDVAVPINQKNEADGNYQIYLSIGQAF